MTTDVITIDSNATITEAVIRLADEHISALAVVTVLVAGVLFAAIGHPRVSARRIELSPQLA